MSAFIDERIRDDTVGLTGGYSTIVTDNVTVDRRYVLGLYNGYTLHQLVCLWLFDLALILYGQCLRFIL